MAPAMAEHYQLDLEDSRSDSACYILRTAKRFPGQCWLHRYLDLDESTEYVTDLTVNIIRLIEKQCL